MPKAAPKTLFLLLLLGTPLPGRAQPSPDAPYLKAAVFYISVDDWADIYLNGTPIIDSQRYTPESSGPQAVTCLPDHLCYFKRENILAIEVSDKSVAPKGERDVVGFSYVLELTSSDGKKFYLSSDDTADHKAFYIGDRMAGEPRGWHYMTFNDEAWRGAVSLGPSLPFAAVVKNPATGRPVSFLSSLGAFPDALRPGERHLYRRKFFLNIGNNPRCAGEAPAHIEPLVLDQPDRRHPVRIPTPTPTPWPTPTPRPIPTPRPLVLDPGISTEGTLEPAPGAPASPGHEVPLVLPGIPSLDEGEKAQAPLPPPSPTPPPQAPLPAAPPPSQGQTIVFDHPPANIYLSYADGPGTYRLDVVDPQGRFVRNLLVQRITAPREGWADWDGKDEGGRFCPRGWYFILFSKDGKLLKKILAGKTGPGS